jgi:hypothetical protein
VILAVVLAAANTYLGLFAGLTVATAIPAAVVSMGVLRLLGGGTILENNIVQTGASAGSSIAAGVIFTIPALIILGYWDTFEYSWVLAIAGLGGLLGVLFSVPLRRSMIVEDPLPFPEGKAAAEVLKAGENPQARTRIVAGLQHLRRGLAFRERQWILDDHRAPQGYREHHAEQPAKACDREHPGIAEVHPVPEDDQRRDGENDAGCDRGAGRSAGLHDVVLEDGATAEHPQDAHRYDRGRDGSGHGQACEQAQVGVRRGQNYRENDGQNHRAQCHLRHGDVVHRWLPLEGIFLPRPLLRRLTRR